MTTPFLGLQLSVHLVTFRQIQNKETNKNIKCIKYETKSYNNKAQNLW